MINFRRGSYVQYNVNLRSCDHAQKHDWTQGVRSPPVEHRVAFVTAFGLLYAYKISSFFFTVIFGPSFDRIQKFSNRVQSINSSTTSPFSFTNTAWILHGIRFPFLLQETCYASDSLGVNAFISAARRELTLRLYLTSFQSKSRGVFGTSILMMVERWTVTALYYLKTLALEKTYPFFCRLKHLEFRYRTIMVFTVIFK